MVWKKVPSGPFILKIQNIMAFKTADHTLVPEHKKLTKDEKAQLLKLYGITDKELPKIMKMDPAINHLSTEAGDVIKITRRSPTAGVSVYYRVVIRGG
jgi:DNA-directed RNA polymerase subunit H